MLGAEKNLSSHSAETLYEVSPDAITFSVLDDESYSMLARNPERHSAQFFPAVGAKTQLPPTIIFCEYSITCVMIKDNFSWATIRA